MEKDKYFDYAATYPTNYSEYGMEKLKELIDNPDIFGNPSSTHILGINANDMLNEARQTIANFYDIKAERIIFTSGGSESNNLAIKGTMFKYKPDESELITSTIEHPSVLETCKQLERFGYTIRYVNPNEDGIIDLESVQKQVNNKTKLISIMSVNNETGNKNPIYLIGEFCKEKGILFHTDAVQNPFNLSIYTSIDCIDFASISGHKFGAMKGVGFLIIPSEYCNELEPLICGGGQEFGVRSGTENVLAICHMSKLFQEKIKNNKELDALITINGIKIFADKLKEDFGDDVIIITNLENSIGTILNVAFKNIDSETLQLMLSNKGYKVSIGSACHSKSSEPSYVLQALNVPKEFIHGAIRISVFNYIKAGDLNQFYDELKYYASKLLNKNK